MLAVAGILLACILPLYLAAYIYWGQFEFPHTFWGRIFAPIVEVEHLRDRHMTRRDMAGKWRTTDHKILEIHFHKDEVTLTSSDIPEYNCTGFASISGYHNLNLQLSDPKHMLNLYYDRYRDFLHAHIYDGFEPTLKGPTTTFFRLTNPDEQGG